MALDATIGGATANSYLEVAEADARAANDPISGAAWQKAPLDERERALVAASDDVDTFMRPAGTPFSTAQALLFPRAIDATGTPAIPFLPGLVKKATYEQAAYLLQNAHLIRDGASRRASSAINQSDDDGSVTLSVNPTFGLYAPRMIAALEGIATGGRRAATLTSIPLTGSSLP